VTGITATASYAMLTRRSDAVGPPDEALASARAVGSTTAQRETSQPRGRTTSVRDLSDLIVSKAGHARREWNVVFQDSPASVYKKGPVQDGPEDGLRRNHDMPIGHKMRKRSFWVSAPFLSGTAALDTAGVAVAGLVLPKADSRPRDPAPAMFGDITDVQIVSRNTCCRFSVQIALSGFKGQDCLVRAMLINWRDGSETRGDELTFTPEADADRARADAFISGGPPRRTPRGSFCTAHKELNLTVLRPSRSGWFTTSGRELSSAVAMAPLARQHTHI
jgi:hypothetical protein